MEYINYKEREPDNTNLYENGTPFDRPDLIYDNLLGQSVPYLKDRQPIVLAIIGGQSTGKTTLAFHFLDIYNYFFGLGFSKIDEKTNPQHSQGGQEFLTKLPKCAEEGYRMHVWDEAGRYSRKNSLSEFNKNMDEAMDTVRVHETAIIIVRHDIHKIPKELIDHEIIGLTILVGIALLIWQIPKLHTVSLNNSSSLEANNSSDTNTTLDSIIPAIDLVLFFSVLFFVLLAIGTFL